MMATIVSRVLGHPLRVPVAVGVMAFGAGVGVGYIFGKRTKIDTHELPPSIDFGEKNRTLTEVREQLEEIKAARKVREEEARTRIIPATEVRDVPANVVEEVPSTEVVVFSGKEFIQKKIDEGHIDPDDDVYITIKEEDPEVVTHSVFADNDDEDWDYTEELKTRGPNDPYVIHKDEFFSEESGFVQVTLTYYDADNIMADEDSTPVYNHEDVTGPMRFGHGSQDPNVFYVRNEKRKAEYEILFDPGFYSEEVLGLEIERNQRAKDVKHSNNRKFRLE